MASLSKDGKNGWRILFVCPTTKKRRTIRTGRCAKKYAEVARSMVERLVAAKVLGMPVDQRTAAWLDSIDGKLKERLVKAGLTEAAKTTQLSTFVEELIDQRRRRGDIAESTLAIWGHARRNLVDYFGAEKSIHTIAPKDADEWAAWLRTDQNLAENTTRKRSQLAKQFFATAVVRKLISENPFAALVGTLVSVPERKVFIPRDAVDLLLDQCLGPEYRLLLVFARYLGVRVPSEIHPLKWTDVDWENQRIVITSPKTKRHRGGGKRVCPIFPEVLPFLQASWEAAPEGEMWIFSGIRSGKRNLRSWLKCVVLRSGLTPWPRLWQNLRATRATELADLYPSHVAAAWLGHSEQIADASYRQITADHHRRAISQSTGPLPAWGKSPKEKPAQKAAQSPHFSAHQDSPRDGKSPGITGLDEPCGSMDSPPQVTSRPV